MSADGEKSCGAAGGAGSKRTAPNCSSGEGSGFCMLHGVLIVDYLSS